VPDLEQSAKNVTLTLTARPRPHSSHFLAVAASMRSPLPPALVAAAPSSPAPVIPDPASSPRLRPPCPRPFIPDTAPEGENMFFLCKEKINRIT
jgi:hypothetical protein